MSRVGFGKKFLFAAAALAALGASASVTKAATITFASYNDSLIGGGNKWLYNNATGGLSATADPANFSAIGGGVLNYNTPITGTTETLSATALGVATTAGSGEVSQHFQGSLTFTDNATAKIVLQIVFTDAVLKGNPSGTTTTSFSADNATNPGSITSFATDPTYLVGGFAQPLKFSISLSQIPGLTIAGNGNFTSFVATSSGSFQVDQSGASPTPLPVAAWGGMSLMGAIGGVGAFIKRRRR